MTQQISNKKKTSIMEASKTKKNPAFLKEVYQLNEGTELTEALQLGLKAINDIDVAQLNRIGLKTYKEGKWTIHRILQHLIDWERIWCFRAIIFARREGTIPEAHDQEIMGTNSNADELSIEQLVNELRIVRQSTIMMFDSFNKENVNNFFLGRNVHAHKWFVRQKNIRSLAQSPRDKNALLLAAR